MASPIAKLTPTRVIITISILLIFYKLLHPSQRPSEYPLSVPQSWSTFGSIFTTSETAEPDTLGFLPFSPRLEAYCAHHRWRPYPDRYHRRKVYDLVFVEGDEELEWLEIRMGEMAKGVDYFVVLESEVTMRGVERWPYQVTVSGEEGKDKDKDKMAKPLHVQENESRFRNWKDKMLVFTLNLTLPNSGRTQVPAAAQTFDTPRSRKDFVNNALVTQTLPYMTDETTPMYGDVIIVSEVNEVVRPSVLQVLRNCEIPRHVRLWTGRFEGGFGWLGPAIRGAAKIPLDNGAFAGGERAMVEGSPEQIPFTDPKLGEHEKGLGVGQWNHPDVTFFSGFRDTPQSGVLRSERGVDAAVVPVDGEIFDAGWACVTCFSSLRSTSERMKAMVAEAKGADEERNKQLETLAFPSEISKRVKMGVETFPQSEQRRPRDEPPGMLSESNGYLQRVEDMLDVPAFLLKSDGRTRKEDYAWLFERDGENAGFVDYWEVMEELEEENRKRER